MLAALFCATASGAGPLYELHGRLVPARRAIVALQSVKQVFQTRVLVDPGGKFRVRKLEPGAYTAVIILPRRGEVRQTIEIGPSTADNKNRVTALFHIEESRIAREPQVTVSLRSYSVKEPARKEYWTAQRDIERGNAGSAIVHLRRAVEIDPKFPWAWNELGTIAYRQGNFPESERCFRQGLAVDPEAYEPMVNLGGVLLSLNQAGEAWEYNVRAVARRPLDPLAQCQLGMTYLALGKLTLAEKSLLEARKLDPAHFSQPQLSLAEIALRTGNRHQAADYLEELLHFHPDVPQAKVIRDNIRKLRGQPDPPRT